MLRFLSGFLLMGAAGLLIFKVSPLDFYLQPKQQRLYKTWRQDLKQLSQDKNFKQIFNQLSVVELHFTDPQVAEEFKDFNSPFKTNQQGRYILKVGITRWIEPDRYGFVIQHEIFDENEDKLHEFGRTYKIGIIF